MTAMNLMSFYKHAPPLLRVQNITPLHLKDLKLLKRNPSSSSPSSSSWPSCCRVQAMVKEKEDSESQKSYEIDRDKAREALQKLDQQLQSLSTKQVSSPKLRASELKFEESEEGVKSNRSGANMRMREKEFEISDSFLGYTAVALVLLTIFYNFLFYAVIAPAIDGPS